MTQPDISRRTFLRATVGVAGSALTSAPILLSAEGATAERSAATGAAGGCSANRLEQASKGYLPRYPGPRWHLIYGSYSGVEKFALEELQRMTQRFVPYVIGVRPASDQLDDDANHIVIGTVTSNPQIADLVKKGLLQAQAQPQGYSTICIRSPRNPERRLVAIAGTDANGVLYGVIEFNKRLAAVAPDDPALMRQALDTIADFSAQDYPLIQNRGIWSWGYVIYDYRDFIDNMARLKMNRLNFWNDVPPVNCREVIDYAHSRGIQVVLGFSWGYDLSTLDPTSSADRDVMKEDVLCQIAQYYQHLGMDALYFQNFTETKNQAIGGRPIAELACDWVNDIAGTILGRYPGLKLEWGLHASSILDHYKYLQNLDPRVVIVWEDAGVIPYSYDPQTTDSTGDIPAMLNSPAETTAYSRKLATFRDRSEFSMVAKGWIQMRWRTESEHHGPFIMGERAQSFIQNRCRERQPRWDFVNSLWLQNYPEAQRFFAEIRDSTATTMSVLGLVEDGLFEEKIQPSIALFAEMIWNPHRDLKDTLRQANNPYYEQIG
jgi:hypothetical protein